MGSKARFTKEILPIILKDRKPEQRSVFSCIATNVSAMSSGGFRTTHFKIRNND